MEKIHLATLSNVLKKGNEQLISLLLLCFQFLTACHTFASREIRVVLGAEGEET